MRPFLNAALLTGLLLMTAFGSVYSQPGADYERRYKAAVRMVQLADYEHAKPELTALRSSPRGPFASYYLALIAFRQKDYNKTRLLLKEITDNYPDWRKLDDVRYLFACTVMETGQYEDALTRLQRIGDPELRTDIDKLERYFLGRVTSLPRLKAMQKEFPSNRNVGLALLELIQRTSTNADDLDLADKLAVQYGLKAAPSPTPMPGKAPPTATTGRAQSKGYYNVAVMFPFRVGTFDAEQRTRSNQYVYDMYEGIKLAKAKLQEEGIAVNLFAYDIDNDPDKVLEVINTPAFQQTDLIIGPLYAEPNRLITAYAGPGGIPVVNPIATSSDLIANQPLVFLAQPSLTQQAEKAVAFAQNLSAVRRAAVYFGSARKDSMLAVAYQKVLQKQGIQVIDWRRVAGTAEVTAANMGFADATKPGCIFLASSNDEDGPLLMDAVRRRSLPCPIIATASAFNEYRTPLATFARHDLYLLYPEFIDAERPEVADFDENYLAKRNIIPSVYTSQGYDLMLFFGRLLAKNAFQERSRIMFKSDTTDYMLSGFDYTQTNDNQVVPIVKIEDGRFVRANE